MRTGYARSPGLSSKPLTIFDDLRRQWSAQGRLGQRGELNFGVQAEVIRRERPVFSFPVEHHPPLIYHAAPVALDRADEDVVDAAVAIEKVEPRRIGVGARPGEAVGMAVGALPRVLPIGAPPVCRVQPA